MSVDGQSSDRDALSGFVASINEAPTGEQEKLWRAARWVENLLAQDLAQLAFSAQPQKTHWTLTVRPKGSSRALAAVFNDGPASVGLWHSVFKDLAPNAMGRVEEVIAPTKLGQGNATRDLSDEFFDALTAAYREAATASDPPWPTPTTAKVGAQIDAGAFLTSLEGEVLATVTGQPNWILGNAALVNDHLARELARGASDSIAAESVAFRA